MENEPKIPNMTKVLIVGGCGHGHSRLKEEFERFKEGAILAFERMGTAFEDVDISFKAMSTSLDRIELIDLQLPENFCTPFMDEAAMIPKSVFRNLTAKNLAKEMRKIKKANRLADTKGNEIWRNKWDKKIKRKI